MTRKLVLFSLAVMTTLLMLVGLWQFRIVIVYMLISLSIAGALRPMVVRLKGKGFVAKALWMLFYLVCLGLTVFLLYLAIKTASDEVKRLSQTLAVQDQWMLPQWMVGSPTHQALLVWLPPPSVLFAAFTGDNGQLVIPAILDITQNFFSFISGLVVILFLSLYWIINQDHFERLWLSVLPVVQRKQARDTWRTIEPDLGSYLRSQVVHSLLAGVLLGLGYWVLGAPYPVLLALVGAICCLIPIVGIVLAVIAPLLVGLLTSVQISLFMVLYTILVLTALGVLVMPRLFNRRWDNPVLTLVLLFFLAKTFGLLGIIIAPPLSAICLILWNMLVSHRLVTVEVAQISGLKERQERLQEIIREMDELPPPLVTSGMERLALLIEKAEPVLLAGLPDEPTVAGLPIAPQSEQGALAIAG